MLFRKDPTMLQQQLDQLFEQAANPGVPAGPLAKDIKLALSYLIDALTQDSRAKHNPHKK